MVPDGLWIYVDNPFSIHISTEIPPSVARGPRPASVAPMNDYEPIPGEPVPSHCNLDTAALHVTVRTRSGRPHIRPLKSVPVIVHIWSHCTPQSLIHISNGVHALHAFHVWAQLSSYLSTENLVVLGDSILAMLVRNGAPDADKLYLELQRFIKEMPPFRGKSICRQAMTLVRPNVWSPAESSHGWAFNATEYRMDDAMSWFLESPFVQEQPFRWTSHGSSSRSEWNMTAIIIERIRSSGAETTKKKERLRAHGWILIIVTAQNLIDEMSIEELALRIARRLAERGATIEFEAIAISLEELARKHGYRYDRRR